MSRGLHCEKLEHRLLLTANLSILDAYLSDRNGVKLDHAPAIGALVYVATDFQTEDLPSVENCQLPQCGYDIKVVVDGVERYSNPLKFGSGETGVGTWTAPVGFWAVTKGSHSVTVELDASDKVGEDESDNSFSFSFSGGSTFQSIFNEPKLVRPLPGVPYFDWTLGNYVDVDPAQDKDLGTLREDFQGGSFTYDGHDALDIGPPTFADQDIGMPVIATASGVVVEMENDVALDRNYEGCQKDKNGKNIPDVNVIGIDHGNDWVTYYFHQRHQSATVAVNDIVQAGDVLGLVGSSGCSSGPHVHFSAYHQGQRPGKSTVGLAVETHFAPGAYWHDPIPYAGSLSTAPDYGTTDEDAPLALNNRERPKEQTIFADIPGKTISFWTAIHGLAGDDHLYGTADDHKLRIEWKQPNGDSFVVDDNATFLDHGFRESKIQLPKSGGVGDWKVLIWDVDQNNNQQQLAEHEFLVTTNAAELAGEIEFNAANYYITEGIGSAEVVVTRSSDIGAVTVDYHTGDWTAKAGSDYVAQSGTLKFLDGELEKTITIGIVDDELHAQEEKVLLFLSNPTGGAILGPQKLVGVNILDDDPLARIGTKGPFNEVRGLVIDANTEEINDTVTIGYSGFNLDELEVEVNGELITLPVSALGAEFGAFPLKIGGTGHEFSFVEVNTGAGNDTVIVELTGSNLDFPLRINTDAGDERDVSPSGDDTVYVLGTSPNVDVAIYAGNGNDNIIVGDVDPTTPLDELTAGETNTINSPIFVRGEKGHDSLLIMDGSATKGKTATITSSNIGNGATDDLFGAKGRVNYTSIEQLNVQFGVGNDTALVRSTHADTETNLLMGDGADKVSVDDGAGTVNGIGNLLFVDGQGAGSELDTATLNDAAETKATTVTISDTEVGQGPSDKFFDAAGRFQYANLEKLNVSTGVNADKFYILATAVGTTTVALGGDGTDLFTVGVNTVDAIKGPVIVDGGGGASNAMGIIDVADPTADHLTVSAALIGAPSDTFFGAPVSLGYQNLSKVSLTTGTGNDTILIQSTAPGTDMLIGGGGGNDDITVLPGGLISGVRSNLDVLGGSGFNTLIVDDSADPTGDIVTIAPTTALAGHIGQGPADDFLPGGALSFGDIHKVDLRTGNTGADTIYLAPAPGPIGTNFELNGNLPTFPGPVDRLNLDLGGVAKPTVTVADIGTGELSSTSHLPVSYQNIEVIDETSGTPFDLIVDLSLSNEGNNGFPDFVEASSGELSGRKTLDLAINSHLAFIGVEASINSLSVVGTADSDTFTVNETIQGLPRFSGAAPGSHTNSKFNASGLLPANVGIHFDGGAQTGTDTFQLQSSSALNVTSFYDQVAKSKSGMVNLEGHFTLSFEQLSPLLLKGHGGTLTMDATELSQMSQMNLLGYGINAGRISADGEFETTTFGGFKNTNIFPPSHITPVIQFGALVNSTGDGRDADPGDGLCETAPGNEECTLRAAIEEANAGPVDFVHFDIPGTGPFLIQPSTSLPVITELVEIDGFTQPGAIPGLNPRILIEVNGDLMDDATNGFVLAAADSIVKGLLITGFENAIVFSHDDTAPSSHVNTLARRQTTKTFEVSVTGRDPLVDGYASGISYFEIYASVQGGPWQWWTNVSPDRPVADYTAESNQSIAFYSIAVDESGNTEAKRPFVEAGTYVPDVDAPVTQVNTVDTTDATLEVAFSGTDSGGSSLSFFDVFVSVDNAGPVKIGSYNAGLPDGSGVFHGSAIYQAIADGAQHVYRFYSVGVDGEGNTEIVPTDPNDVKKTATFSAPAALQVAAFDVQQNAVQRSFVRYVDVTFNQDAGLAAMIASLNDDDDSNDRIRLLRFGLNGAGSGQSVNLAGHLAAVDNVMAFDFGRQGIGGNRNSNAGDGYYRLLLDLDGDGDFDDDALTFYRLFGDVNADRSVDNLDIRAITAAFGKTGGNLDEDVNGDGVVNALDRLFAIRGRRRKLNGSLPLSD